MRDTINSNGSNEELRRNQEFLRLALDTLDDVFYALDTSGKVTHWNKRAIEVTGYTAGELAGMDAADLFPEEDQSHILKAVEEAIETGESVVESELLTADGDRIPYEFTGARLTGEKGEIRGIVGIGRDISSRNEYERQLTALHDFADELTQVESVQEVYTRTVEASEDILEFDLSLVSIEDDGVLIPAVTSSGITSEEVIEMSVDEGIGGKAYRTKNTFLIDNITDHSKTQVKGSYESVISVPIRDYGNFQAISGVKQAFDESERKLAELLIARTENALERISREQKLEKQNEHLEKFARVASHDLRNPLNVAQGRIKLAKEEPEVEHLEAAGRAVDRSLSLVEDLLTLAREGKQVNNLESIDLGGIAKGCWPNVDSEDGELVVESEQTIQADPSRVKQLLENLMRNAVEHGGSSVTVEIGDIADGFYVVDDGSGIPKADREKVFELGYSTGEGGTGFGLNIVQEISTAHGWEVEITDADGGGARFEFTSVDSGS